jgi:hypothetical protein
MVPLLYNLDFVVTTKGKMDPNENRDFVWVYVWHMTYVCLTFEFVC